MVVASPLLGCSGKPSPTATVSGVVKINGNPAPKGTSLIFHDAKTGKSTVGKVGENGNYTGVTDGVQGIFVGSYQVSAGGPAAEIDPEEALKPGFKAPEDIVPEKYRSTSTSGLSVDITDGSNTYNVDLK